MKNRVQADPVIDGIVRVPDKTIKQLSFVAGMKGIDDLICKTNKAIDRMDRVNKITVEEAYAERKRGAIAVGDQLAALISYFAVQVFHLFRVITRAIKILSSTALLQSVRK
jgi:hypothetical protein